MGRQHPFNELLREAYHAAEAVDLFDVHSEDPASVAEFERLQALSDSAEQALVDHVLEDERVRQLVSANSPEPRFPPEARVCEVTKELHPALTRALNIVRSDNGGPAWPPQDVTQVPCSWELNLGQMEMALRELSDIEPAPEDPDAVMRAMEQGKSFLDSELYSFCCPQDDVGEQMAARNQGLRLACDFLEAFFNGWPEAQDAS